MLLTICLRFHFQPHATVPTKFYPLLTTYTLSPTSMTPFFSFPTDEPIPLKASYVDNDNNGADTIMGKKRRMVVIIVLIYCLLLATPCGECLNCIISFNSYRPRFCYSQLVVGEIIVQRDLITCSRSHT